MGTDALLTKVGHIVLETEYYHNACIISIKTQNFYWCKTFPADSINLSIIGFVL